MIKMYWGDCAQIIPKLTELFQLVFTSPPYNVNVDYGECKDNLELNNYINWLVDIFCMCAEKLTPGGHICIQMADTGKQPYLPKIEMLTTKLQESWNLKMRSVIIWDKQNETAKTAWGSWCSPNSPSIRERHEYISVWRKDGNREGKSDLEAKEFMKLTESIWRVTPETSLPEHPAPFPINLAKQVIKLYSFIGETVLDPFAGSGTTLRAARELQRNAIGIEINESYKPLVNRRTLLDTPNLDAWN